LNVSLTPQLDKFVVKKVASGRYTSASEVIREALRLMEERDQARTAELTAFHDELSQRLKSLDRGEHVDPVSVRKRIEKKSSERRRQRS
jgi:antitoxin ParD1/3/4